MGPGSADVLVGRCERIASHPANSNPPTKRSLRRPMRRSFRTRRMLPGGFPGFAPWAGMRCPYRAWGSKPGLGHGSRRRLALRQNGIEPDSKIRSERRSAPRPGSANPATEEKETLARAARWDPGGLFLLLSGEVGHEVDELLFGHGWGERGHEGGRHFVAAGEVGFFQF